MTTNQVMASISAALAIGFGAGLAIPGDATPELEACVAIIEKEAAKAKPAEPDVADYEAKVPKKSGRLLSCVDAVANIDPGTPQAKRATMRCQREDGGILVDQWLEETDAKKVRDEKVKVKESKAEKARKE